VDTTHPDPDAAAAFYGGVFGWDLEDVMPPGSGGKYLIARLQGGDVAAIGSVPDGAPPVAAWNTYIWVDSADETAAKVLEAGGSIVVEPFDLPQAGRMAVCADGEGAPFRLWQAAEHRGARIVNEPGSLNFNGLNTRDPARAKSFYRSVFGWETLSLGVGAEMWTLPGYGDFLERSDPGLRQRLTDMGTVAGFADVVATLNPIAEEQRDVPAHWSVTFAVEDADAIAERAAALGGEVMAGPLDAPWVRMTAIRDPQGASFIATKFVPENRDLEGQPDSAVAAA
jgi:predicted enzyme related to lactoylglutathione lyase